MKKVVPSERLRRELDDVLNDITEEEDPIEAVARLGARLILQQALEDEVSEFVGRARHERAHGGEGVIYRNGFAEPSTVRTTSGPTVIERPRVRDATKVGFESRVLGARRSFGCWETPVDARISRIATAVDRRSPAPTTSHF